MVCRGVAVVIRFKARAPGSLAISFGVIGCRTFQHESLHLLVSESELPETYTTNYEEKQTATE